MFGFTIGELARFCGGKLSPEQYCDAVCGHLEIDSRSICPGDVFCAFRGEKSDGHDYIDKAISSGAICAIAERYSGAYSERVILVPDVSQAMIDIAREFRKRLEIPFVGITGSMGKTTAKEMIALILSRRFKTHKTSGNFNNLIGLPITVSGVSPDTEVAVVEMGISKFGEMECLAGIARPNIVVYTNIGHTHLEFLNDLEGVFKAKTELISVVDDSTILVVNGDDKYLRRLNCRPGTISYGFNENNTYRACGVSVNENGEAAFDILCPFGTVHAVAPAPGKHIVLAALASFVVCNYLGMKPDEIINGIKEYTVPDGRGSVIKTKDYILLDNSYNANPQSMRVALNNLLLFSGRHIAVLGDMLELGEESLQMHAELGEYACDIGVDVIISCGPLAKEIFNVSSARGVESYYYSNVEEMKAALPGLLKYGDTVLLKASNGMRFASLCSYLKNLG